MTPRPINRTLIICSCRRPIELHVSAGETIRTSCICGNVIITTFPNSNISREEEIRKLIQKLPRSRWEAIGQELLFDELKKLEQIT